MSQTIDIGRGAHCRIDFIDCGQQFFAGESYPLEGRDAVKLERLRDARWILPGPPSPELAARAKERRAATAPPPPTTTQQPRAQAQAGKR